MPHIRLRKLRVILVAVIGAWVWLGAPVSAQEGADPETIQEGARLYAENCAVCHGEAGSGRVGATLAQDWPAIRPDLRVKETIMNGVPGSFMPAWSQANGGPLAEDQIDAIVAYILTWETGEPVILPTPTLHPPITPLPEVEGDPNRGAVLFAENCAVCHGKKAEGRIGAPLAKDWPAIRTDLRLRETISRGVTGSFMPAWSQANGGPLTDEEIADLVAYILTLSPSLQTPTAASPTVTSTPEAPAPGGGNVGLIVGGVVLVLIIIGGVIWATRRA